MSREEEAVGSQASAGREAASPGGEPMPGSFALLLVAVSVVYALNALALESPVGVLVTWASRAFVLLASIYLLSGTRRTLVLAIVFSSLTLALEAGVWGVDAHTGRILLDTAAVGFMVWVLYTVMRGVFHRNADSRDAVLGSMVGYLLLLATFTRLHSLLEDLWPGSYQAAYPALLDQSEAQMNATFQYFSTVTMTTLGFGDIVPVSRLSQFATGLEAVIGQLYIAVVVASLVGRAAERR